MNDEREFQAVTGGCLLIKTDLFRELNGFDERYIVAAYEDLDLCLRARQKGFKVVYAPKAELIHYESVTQNKFDDSFRKAYFKNNHDLFMSEWNGKFEFDYNKYDSEVD